MAEDRRRMRAILCGHIDVFRIIVCNYYITHKRLTESLYGANTAIYGKEIV